MVQAKGGARAIGQTSYFFLPRLLSTRNVVMLAFDIRYDLYGQGEPRVVLYKPGTMTPGETISLSEAERRGIVSEEQAEPLYQRALLVLTRAVGPEHPGVATMLENYALMLRVLNRDAEADTMEARAQAIRAKHAQENPPK